MIPNIHVWRSCIGSGPRDFEKPSVIPSEARNLSRFSIRKKRGIPRFARNGNVLRWFALMLIL
jgi:hypothetical protein